MIPYIHIPDMHIGPLPIHPFGVLVATGVLVGTSLTTRRARLLGYDLVELNSFITWMLVSGFVLSHVLDQLFYHWDDVLRRPWSLAMPWEGLSSFGGFIGGLVGILLWKFLVIQDGRLRVRQRPHPIFPYADLVLSVFPVAWIFGRSGCASVHDHPGARAATETLLAVAYPLRPGEGAVTRLGFIELIQGHDPRFDLGLLELMFTIVLAACFVLTWRRRLATGTYVIVAALAYAPVRFAMDFLRISQGEGGDTRYADLTPAQWSCIALFVFGLGTIGYVRRLHADGKDPADALRVAPPEPEAGVKVTA